LIAGPQSVLGVMCRRLESRITLSLEETEALRALPSVLRRVPAGSSLDAEPRRFELLLSGIVCRYTMSRVGRRQIIAYLVPGDFCGSHFGDLPYSDYRLAALSRITTASLSGDGMAQLAARFPRLLRTLRIFEMTEEATTRQWLLNLGQRDALERTSHLLCELYVRLSRVGLTSPNGCALPLTQGDLADALAMSSVHMNRTLMKLRRQKLASLLHYWLTLYDFEELKSIAGFTPAYLGIDMPTRQTPSAILVPSDTPATADALSL
jgi:CRP-like cAMP-binding protein